VDELFSPPHEKDFRHQRFDVEATGPIDTQRIMQHDLGSTRVCATFTFSTGTPAAAKN